MNWLKCTIYAVSSYAGAYFPHINGPIVPFAFQKLYSLLKFENARNLCAFTLNKLKKINLVATATYGFTHKTTVTCFHGLGDIGTCT